MSSLRRFASVRFLSLSSAFAAAAILIDGAHASVPYTTPDSTYTENFDELPTDARSNNSIQTGATGSNVNYTNGWQDDTTTVSGDHISLPGWYLYHALSPGGTTGENGTNHHQRFRYGSGTGTTGSFFAFSSSTTDTDRALGFLPSTTVASDPVADPTASNDDTMFMGVRLTNNTGQTLNQFTLGFDGEQWRDAGSSTVTPVNFSWLVTPSSAAATTIHQIAGYTSVSQLGFSSPVATATGAAVIGNTDGKVTVAPFTVTGINWADGTDLWLRWGDQQQKTIMDNGMAIDNVSFLASIGTPPAGVQGDYNNNGVVDMADYVLWRNGGPLQNEVDNTGTVDAGDYAAWRTRFGNTSGSGSSLSGAAVPEPTTLVFAFLLSLPVITSRVRRDRNAV